MMSRAQPPFGRPTATSTRGGRTQLDWPILFRCLAEHMDYEERLDGLLEAISTGTGLPVVALYLADDPESRFQLARLRRPLSEEKPPPARSGGRVAFLGGALGSRLGRAEADIMAYEVDEEANPDSVAAIVASPLLDLPRREEYAVPHLVSTPLGTLYSVPLMREARTLASSVEPSEAGPNATTDAPQVEQVGIVQAGPVAGEPDRCLRRRIEALAPPLAHAAALAHEQARLANQVAAFETRADVSRQMLRSAFELDEFLTLLLDLAVRASRAEAGFIALANEDGVVSLHTAIGLPEGLLDGVDLTPGTGFLDWLDEADRSLYVADFERAAELGLRTILAVPLVEQEAVLGVLGLVSFSEGRTPAAHSLTLLGVLAGQIQLVLGNVRLLELFNQQYVGTIHALARALDGRYPHTAAHHRRVTDVALEIAGELGWGAGRLETLHAAGLAHDVGMCGIVEVGHGYQADFHHPTVGADMFDVLPNGRIIGETIAAHHEWYDGWGFPDGLRGDEIPEGARILTLAEFVVESTTADPIQPAMAPSGLLEEVNTRRGRQFDPAVVQAWQAVFERQRAQAPAGGPFRPCRQFKGEPEGVCVACPARSADTPCWTEPSVRCAAHGDPDCGGCFVYLEARERADAAGEHLPAPAVRAA